MVKIENGLAQLVNVELKSVRARTEVFDQVIDFRDVIEHEDLVEFWRQFAKETTGQTFRWDESLKTRGIVVWPASKNPKKAKKIEGIDEVEYTPMGDDEYPSSYTLALPALI
ncbi:MAG TPA: hypothetical protein VFC29_17505 [Candidatus Limnocylindrales bacterium]|nr:hypothetical protein [Candidatus Limnocylindrales bacterium]